MPTPRTRPRPPAASRRDAIAIGLMWMALAAVVAIAGAADIRMTRLTKDPLGAFESNEFYLGLLSHAGVLAWATAAAIALFARSVVHADEIRSTAAAFLGALGVLTAVLALDDLLMVHDLIGPDWLGVPDEVFYAVYAVGMLVILATFQRYIVTETRWGILAVALALFACSVTVDAVDSPIGTDIEDGLKLAGIFAYAYYCVTTARDSIAKASSHRRP